MEFVDTCQCGDYHFTIDRSEKDALAKVPGAGLTQWEEMGMAKKADRFKGGFENLGAGPMSQRRTSPRNSIASNWPPSCLLRRRSSSGIWKAP